MALKWQYRSDSTTQARYATGWRDMTRIRSASALTLTAGPTGTFGGTYLDQTSAPEVVWPGHDNGPVGTTAIAVLFRLIPIASGNPAANKGIFQLSGARAANGNFGGLSFMITSAGKLAVTGGSLSSGINYFNAAAFATALTLTANVPTDIWFVWPGTTTANAAECWQAQNGATPTKIATLTASAAASAWLRGAISDLMNVNLAEAVTNNAFHINEIAIFDTAENPASYGARTDFIAASAFEGYNTTAFAASDVRSGVSAVQKGVTVTGTAAIPARANVRLSTLVDNTTGLMIAAAAATTKIGVTADDGVGVYDGSERYTDFGDSNIVAGQSGKFNSTTNNRAGTAVVAVAATTKHGVTANDGTGAYRGYDLWTSVQASELKSGVSLNQDGVTVAGTYKGAGFNTDPGVGSVSTNTAYMILGVPLVGTRDTVTNVLSSVTLSGPSYSATLEES
jgi:hypothetical protein